MMRSNTFTIVHARAVLPDGVRPDCAIRVEDGVITAVGPDIDRRGPVVDACGNDVLPGFIDLHSDAIEREIETRPGSCMPVDMALAELDKKLAAAGVCTICHSLAFAEKQHAIIRTMAMADSVARQIREQAPLLGVHTLVHIRYEITDTEALPLIEALLADGQADLVSLMDHTPGQGQFKTYEQFRDYYGAYFSPDEDAIRAIVEKRQAIKEHVGMRNAARLAAACRAHGIPIASHDDDSEEKVDFVADCGVTISEFPVTREACRHARAKNMRVAVGAPNIVRGSSHNGNLNALEIVRDRDADLICSDYVPSTLLHALYRIHDECARPLHEISPLFSANPAAALGLNAVKGRIAPGFDADLIIANRHLAYPRIAATFVKGREVYASWLR